MKIIVQSSKLIKPYYAGRSSPPPAATDAIVPLTVFDKVNLNKYVSRVSFFRPPAPPIAAFDDGLARALAAHRECAGRLGAYADGRRAILLNDAGGRFVEATADVTLGSVSLPLEPAAPVLLRLLPRGGNGVEELLLVQVTWFTCGSFVVGTAAQHLISDGRDWRSFFVAWGNAIRGAAIGTGSVSTHRASVFVPRNPPLVQFEHRGVDFKPRRETTGGAGTGARHAYSGGDELVIARGLQFNREMLSELKSMASSAGAPRAYITTVQFEHRGAEFKPRRETMGGAGAGHAYCGGGDEVVVARRLQFSREMVSELKSMESSAGAHISTLKCLVAHLWQCITKARGLQSSEATMLHLAVDGRSRMRHPPVPEGYAGNVVLWARPATTAGELLAMPLWRAVELIGREVSRVDESYFRSFVDFACSGAVEEEGLVPAADAAETVLCSDVEVYSMLGMPVYELDFVTGRAFLYMPSYRPTEGLMLIVPSSSDDGSVVAYVYLFSRAMDIFEKICYSLPTAIDARM